MGMSDVGAVHGGASSIERLAVTIDEASQISGFSRSEIYRRSAEGELAIVKAGRRSLVILASLRRIIEAQTQCWCKLTGR